MSEWYQRQFGDRGEFAIIVSLGTDPHPSGWEALDAAWGSLEIWASGRCLTQSVTDGGAVSAGVRWSVLPVLEWLLAVGIRLVNEDPYPRISKGADVGDACAWYDATLSPPMLDAEAEDRWFLLRSEWRHHHALRRAAEDVALPNVVFRRLGHCVEVSWDNQAWAPPRPDLRFVERRGRELVAADTFADVVRQTLVDVSATLATRSGNREIEELHRSASNLRVGATDWRWLVHRPTAEVIRNELPDLCERLDRLTAAHARGFYVPHTRDTLVLRQVRLDERSEIEAVLRAAEMLPERPLTPDLERLIRPRPASSERPWEAGNDYAETVREAMGWGTGPLPELADWLVDQGMGVPGDLGLPSAIEVLAERSDDARAMVHVNPRAPRIRKETGLATALGHVLLDDGPVSVDGTWEHWPTAARARAFGVALMLPEYGVRDLLGGAQAVGETEVRHLMAHFGAGPYATTYRLQNLGIISREERAELVSIVA